MDAHVRRARREDNNALLDLWERSVRATHHFLEEQDIVALRPLVAEELRSDAVEWWVLVTGDDALLGFLGFANNAIEGLFIDSERRGQGAGKRLVAHAESLATGPLAVDVNEQNPEALRFYESLGFTVFARSPTDAGGRPFPILHMRRSATSAGTTAQ